MDLEIERHYDEDGKTLAGTKYTIRDVENVGDLRDSLTKIAEDLPRDNRVRISDLFVGEDGSIEYFIAKD